MNVSSWEKPRCQMNVSSWEKPRSQGPLLLGEVELETECLFKVKMLIKVSLNSFYAARGPLKSEKKKTYNSLVISFYLSLSTFTFSSVY